MTPVPTYASLMIFMKQRMGQVEMTLGRFEEIAGFAEGSAAHVFLGNKDFSGPSLFVALNTLGCTLQVEEDPDLLRKILANSRYKPRSKSHSPLVRSKPGKRVIRRDDMKIWGRKGGLATAALPRDKISKITRRAALKRWRRARIAVVT